MLSKKPDLPKGSFWSSFGGFLVFALIVILLWSSVFWIWRWFFGEPDGAGTAGDMFGGVTALFSGLAFAGLISTLLMQRQELEFQRIELRQTREVFSIQRFESTLFGMLRLLNDHVPSIQHSVVRRVSGRPVEGPVSYGRKAIKAIAEDLPRATYEDVQKDQATGEDHHVAMRFAPERLVSIYEDMYRDKLEPDLAPYYRILYNIFRLIDTSEFSEDLVEDAVIKKDYARIVRAHISSSEVKLLMFNGLSFYGKEFKHWTEKYGLLKHLSDEDKKNYSHLLDEYDPSARDESS
jgi:hypothetical protein